MTTTSNVNIAHEELPLPICCSGFDKWILEAQQILNIKNHLNVVYTFYDIRRSYRIVITYEKESFSRGASSNGQHLA